MLSTPFRPLLQACLCLPLLSTACATASTPASIVRTERPKLPTLPADLTRAERLQPLSAKPTGELVTIDKGILTELYERLAEAIAAVLRANTRAAAVKLERRCTTAILSTGTAPADCLAAN